MHELNRNMKFRDLVIMGLLFIGPAAPVGLFGVLDATSDGAVTLVYLVATLTMAFTALSYARMATELPNAGAVYAYCSAGIHPKVGFLVGWLLFLDYMLIPAVAYLFSGISLNAIMPDIPVWAWTSVAVVVTVSLNLVGIKKSAKFTLAMLIIEIVVLAIVLIAGLYLLAVSGPQRDLLEPFTGGLHFTWSQLFAAVSIAVLSYLGFDAIATFSEEHHGSRSATGKAIIVCLFLAGALFMLQTYVGALLSPYSAAYLRENPQLQGAAFYTIVNTQLGAWIGIALAVMKGVGAAFAAMVGQAAAGRLLFSMSRDGRLPKLFTIVGKESGVPTAALIFTALFNMLLAIVAGLYDDGLGTLVSFVDIGALSAFIMLNVAVIGYFRVKKARRGGMAFLMDVVMPCAGILILLPVLFNIKGSAQIVGLVWLAVGIVVMQLSRNKATPAWLESQQKK